MANNQMLVAEREKQVGSFLVGRLLPFRRKRQVGPFTFIDHMGPNVVKAGDFFDVDQHPHIGLSTLTYLIEGQIEHRDSTGAQRIIEPGSVNFMTAGKGVSHTERTPAEFRAFAKTSGAEQTVHGYQVWVALPTSHEEMEPRFDHVAASDLPQWQDGDLHYTLIAGEGFGQVSPLPVYSPLFMLDVKSQAGGTLDVKQNLKGEIAVVVVAGRALIGEQCVEPGEMLISLTEDECCIDLDPQSRVLLFGGEAFPEPRHMYWNFVHSSKDRIEQAKAEWAAKQFPKVPGDDTYIPLPG